MASILSKTSFGAVVATIHYEQILKDWTIINDIQDLDFEEFEKKYPVEMFNTQICKPYVAELTMLFSKMIQKDGVKINDIEYKDLLFEINQFIERNTVEYSPFEVRQHHWEYTVDLPF